MYRFDGLELDPGARTLLHEGKQVVLNPRTFDLLVYLARNAQTVVTKERLLAEVWPGSFVEESNLSQHIYLLRRALGATGHSARIVTTIPGKGYQLSTMVEQIALRPPQSIVSRPGVLVLHAVQSVTRVVTEEETDDESGSEIQSAPATSAAFPPALPAARKRLSPVAQGVAAAAVVLLAAGSFLGWRLWRPSRTDHVDLVLSDLENTTGDPEFDHVLNQALVVSLGQSPYLQLVSRLKIQQTLTEMQHSRDEKLTPELALEVCERNNAQAMLHGSIAQFGGKYLLILDARSCVSGKEIAGYKAEVSSKEDVLSALDRAADRVRRQLGESSASLERFQTPIAQATTPSLEALRDYTQARDRFDHGDGKTAEELLKQAIALDPGFASAYSSLGAVYFNRNDFNQAAIFYKKGFDLRGRTSERERLTIEIAYHYGGDRDYEEVIRGLKLFNRTFPNDATSWGRLCNQYTQLGQYSQAIEAGEQAYRIDPHSSFVTVVLARAYKRAGRFAAAKAVANAAVAQRRDTWGVHSILFQIAYGERDAAGIKQEGEWGLSHQQTAASLDDLAYAAATSGKRREAMDDLTRARTAALHDGDADFADLTMADLADILIDLGDQAKASETLKLRNGDAGAPGEIAFLRASAGNMAAARHFVETQNVKELKDTMILDYYLPLVQAQLALADHKPAAAVDVLEPARPYQLRDYRVPWLRAQAELQAGRVDAALADFHLILDNPGIDPLSPMLPMAHLGVARAYALEKNRVASRNEYESFFALWRDADASLPVLRQARAEYARLQ